MNYTSGIDCKGGIARFHPNNRLFPVKCISISSKSSNAVVEKHTIKQKQRNEKQIKAMKYLINHLFLLCKSNFGKRLADREKRGKKQRKQRENASKNRKPMSKLELWNTEIEERKKDENSKFKSMNGKRRRVRKLYSFKMKFNSQHRR